MAPPWSLAHDGATDAERLSPFPSYNRTQANTPLICLIRLPTSFNLPRKASILPCEGLPRVGGQGQPHRPGKGVFAKTPEFHWRCVFFSLTLP
jgi:hypothetical protein